MRTQQLTLDLYLSLPRLSELDVSPDGLFLTFTAGRPSSDGTKSVSDLYRVATDGSAQAERLTRGDWVDQSPRYLRDGSLLFLSTRPASEPEPPAEGEESGATDDKSEPSSQLWLLPPAGEPRMLTRRAGPVKAFARARSAVAVLLRAGVLPGSVDIAADRAAEKERKRSGVSAQVYDSIPIRFWDRFFGPRFDHLFAASDQNEISDPRDLTPDATIEVDDLGFDVSPDGRLVCAAERERDERGLFFENLRLFDLETGESRRITGGRDVYGQPRFSPDGRTLVCVFREQVEGKTGRQWLVEVPAEGDDGARPLTKNLDLWPEGPVYAPDGRAIFFIADVKGHRAVFRLSLKDESVTRLSSDSGACSDLVTAPDGSALYAIASGMDRPPEVVALNPERADQEPRALTRLAGEPLEASGLPRPESLMSKGTDGRDVHSWLLTPAGQPPAGGHPLLLWVHGGPLGAWTDEWHWRWNPQLFAARGYAVLLVNPRISTGYGQDFIEEGHGRWGAEPYEDLMGAVDVASERPDIDAERIAIMGGSFGGYMANWIAGHTHRFRCIVSHAGLYQLVGFHGTTDWGMEWEREFAGDPYRHPEVYERWSPHGELLQIKTPMLIVHGEKDYRVPVTEAFQLFTALQRLGVPSRLLYFPDENHWILRPPNTRIWHETIFEWLERWLNQS